MAKSLPPRDLTALASDQRNYFTPDAGGVVRTYAIVLAMMTANPLGAQTIGLVSLRLGDPQASVVAKLSEYYALDSTEKNIGLWSVHERSNVAGKLLGVIMFRGGKLDLVSREWDAEGGDTQSFAQTLIRALSRLENEPSCRVHHDGLASPNGNTVEAMEVYCRGHQVRVATITLTDKVGRQISESWFTDSSPPPLR